MRLAVTPLPTLAGLSGFMRNLRSIDRAAPWSTATLVISVVTYAHSGGEKSKDAAKDDEGNWDFADGGEHVLRRECREGVSPAP